MKVHQLLIFYHISFFHSLFPVCGPVEQMVSVCKSQFPQLDSGPVTPDLHTRFFLNHVRIGTVLVLFWPLNPWGCTSREQRSSLM